GVAGGVAALVAAPRSAYPAGVVGALALAAFAADLPGASGGATALPLRVAAAGLAGGAGPGSAVAVSLAATADAIGGALARDRESIATASTAVAGALVAFAGQAVRKRTRGTGGAGVAPVWVAAVAAGLIAENVARSLEGTRSRLAPLVVPAALAASLAPRSGRSLPVALGAGMLAASAVSRVTAAVAPTAASVVVAPMAEAPVVVPTPVVVRPARGSADPDSGAASVTSATSDDGVDTNGTEVAASS
ncbi:MAG: hypothetical protein KDB40_22345, partial [Acidimicrobiales bacterium]|nr:hypothetical protein [Acidimicrobiales bacterium]